MKKEMKSLQEFGKDKQCCGIAGKCSDYKHRLPMCRKYPQKRIFYNAKLHDGCGYKVNVKTFKDYLDKKSK